MHCMITGVHDKANEMLELEIEQIDEMRHTI